MNIEELAGLVDWVEYEIVEKNISNAYDKLIQALQQNLQANQQQSSFEEQKNTLLSAIGSVDLSQLNKEQVAFLGWLHIEESVGDQAIKSVEDILFRNVIDIATSVKHLESMYSGLQTGIGHIQELRNGLPEQCFEFDEDSYDDVLIRVKFEGEASLANVRQFKAWGSKWHEIGRGVAMAHGASPDDFKIVGASKGSVILVLSVAAAAAKTVLSILKSALEVADKCMDIRLKAGQIQALKLSNKGIANELLKEAEKTKETTISAALDEQIASLKLVKTKDGEKIVALAKSVKSLIDFVDKGGQLDFVIPQLPEEGEEDEAEIDDPRRELVKELQTLHHEIRHIEENIKLLSHDKDKG